MRDRLVSDSEFGQRVSRLRGVLLEQNLDALIVWGRGGGTVERYGNVAYLCDFYPSFPTIRDVPGVWSDRGYCAVVVTKDEVILCSDDKYAADEAVGVTRCLSLDGGRGNRLADLISEALGSQGNELRIGVTGVDTMTAKQFAALDQSTRSIRAGDLAEKDDLVESLRMLKSPAEIGLMQRAAMIVSEALEAGFAHVVPGGRETDVSAAITGVLSRREAVLANAFMITFGDHAEDPRHRAPYHSDLEFKEGSLFTIDLSGAFDGYFFDLARSRVVGRAPSPEQQSLYDLAKDSVNATVGALKVGHSVGEAARAGRALLDQRGYHTDNDEFQARGHGLGLGFEAPWIREDTEVIVQEGMTLAIEQFCVVDGVGATFERNVVVTSDGAIDLFPVADFW